jgi:hypothetical protein
MPPRKYAPEDPKARAAIAKRTYVERNRDKRRAYERNLRARHKAAGTETYIKVKEYQARYLDENRDKIKARAAAKASQKWAKEKAKLSADPEKLAQDRARRAKNARFKNSGLPWELFEIQDLSRSIKLKVNELRNTKDDAL